MIKHVVEKFKTNFTKSELLAFSQLTRFSVKIIGICNARICKLVEATQDKKGGISRSTFERMLRKAKQLGILSIHHTTREKGGFSHSVYIFHRFDGALTEKLTEREQTPTSTVPTVQRENSPTETNSFETKTKRIKDLRPITLEDLDYTYVPNYVPESFVKVVKPFYDRAKDICQLWDRALIAYRSQRLVDPIERFLPTIIKAFKALVYQWKHNKINTSFIQYYYGTVVGMLAVESRRIIAEHKINVRHWLYR
ncbi:hypothetical protein H1D32_24190 [Anaerobacillus sp. CMMVII]|uniref:hypothetical protein n=1 Tax=Anaerobacillus sp. CMMVII TaxID=2755588 RepID=UPI0021B76B45|nr:hypothetical protein [Anaerobacillus sp. CMMVII]MCT8140501.1 hypothetical protein [Anaerobacillus sp. CMMVII]